METLGSEMWCRDLFSRIETDRLVNQLMVVDLKKKVIFVVVRFYSTGCFQINGSNFRILILGSKERKSSHNGWPISFSVCLRTAIKLIFYNEATKFTQNLVKYSSWEVVFQDKM